MADKMITDRAFNGHSPFGLVDQDTYSGALSYLRRPYSKDLSETDVAVVGIPYDLTVTNRPGTRFGPRAIRQASSQLAWGGGPWRWDFDPTEVLRITDWGDVTLDHGRPRSGCRAQNQAPGWPWSSRRRWRSCAGVWWVQSSCGAFGINRRNRRH